MSCRGPPTARSSALGRSQDAVAWSTTFEFRNIAEPQPCPAGSVQFDSCEVFWFDVICPLGVTANCPPRPGDAGVPDAAAVSDASVVGPPANRGGCGGCRLAGLLLTVPWLRRGGYSPSASAK